MGPTPDPFPCASSVATAPRWKRRPSTAARCRAPRSSGSEPVDAGGEERVDRRRHLVIAGPRIVGQHREQLLDEERVALGRLDDPRRGGPTTGRAHRATRRRGCPPRPGPAARARRAFRAGAPQPTTAARRTDRDARGRGAGSERRSRSRRGTRAGRAESRSAQWTSSTTRTSGRADASVSNSRRNAQAVSSGDPGVGARADRARDQPRRDVAALDVGEQPRELGPGSSPASSRTTSASGR